MRKAEGRRQKAEGGGAITLKDTRRTPPRRPVNARGYTLVELMIVAVVFLIIGGGLLTTLLTGRTSYLSADAYLTVQQESRRAFDTMVRELREAGNVTPAATNANQLNFQIARGYNTEVSCQNPAAICWGSDNATNEWVHYKIVNNLETPRNPWQLIRYRDGASGGAPPAQCNAPGCRVLSNNVRAPGVNPNAFQYDSANKVLTITLQNAYANPALPTGQQATAVLTSRVKLRN